MAISFPKTKTFFRALSSTGNFFQHFLLLAFRLYFGLGFVMAGLRKFTSMNETSAYFSQLKIPLPEFFSYLVASTEVVCGALLIIGLASRLASLPLIITMIVALLTAHAKGAIQIISNPSAFLSETPVTFLMALLVIFVSGAGWFSLDYFIGRYYGKEHNTQSS